MNFLGELRESMLRLQNEIVGVILVINAVDNVQNGETQMWCGRLKS